MKYVLRLVCGIVLLGIAPYFLATAQQSGPVRFKQSVETNIAFYVSNTGIVGLNPLQTSPGFEVPRGSGKGYIFGSGLWFGAMKRHEGTLKKLYFPTLAPNAGLSWATPGEYQGDAADPDLYRSSDYNRETGEPLVAASRPNWPMWLLPDEHSSFLHTGMFVPQNEDRTTAQEQYAGPAFATCADEEFAMRYHDNNLDRYPMPLAEAQSLGYPLGLQFEQHVYGWASGELKDAVIIKYTIINASADTLFNCSVAQITDFDIGSAANDRTTYYKERPELRMSVSWSGSEDEEFGTLISVLLEGPIRDEASGFVINEERERFKAEGEITAFINLRLENSPITVDEHYDIMQSEIKDQDSGPGDLRMLLSQSSFNMAPGDTAHFAVAYAVAEDVMGDGTVMNIIDQAGLAKLEQLAEMLIDRYYEAECAVSSVDIPGSVKDLQLGLRVVPNPVQNEARLQYSIQRVDNVRLVLYNNVGEKVAEYDQGVIPAGDHTAAIDISAFPAGSYVVTIEAGGQVEALRLVIVR